jgi:hypothetical protein
LRDDSDGVDFRVFDVAGEINAENPDMRKTPFVTSPGTVSM